MRRLLLEDAGRDVVELAADALLPLMAAHPAAFHALGVHFMHACIHCGWHSIASPCQNTKQGMARDLLRCCRAIL